MAAAACSTVAGSISGRPGRRPIDGCGLVARYRIREGAQCVGFGLVDVHHAPGPYAAMAITAHGAALAAELSGTVTDAERSWQRL
jgi:hypothetical protein